MRCSDAHLAIGAEPQSMSPELEQHLRTCELCSEYRREMLDLDTNIQRALKLDLAALASDASVRSPVRAVASTPSSASPAALRSVRGNWALAASVLFAVAVGFVLWGALPLHSLAADVVAHVISEPLPANQNTAEAASKLAPVLAQADVQLDALPGEVTFAQTCFFRGRLVPHFVVRTGRGPVTVLILPNEQMKSTERFAESGYRGVLLPDAGHGSIAVLSRADLNAEQTAREILASLHVKPHA
jgi:hypothetical protein